ncbi:MAG: nucleic acid-binding protein, partial [Armatimonadetes bacterium]|nr:nucleic acid-binding protein [Armatimonadota bacterium]
TWAEQQRLRGYDAVQLASALSLQQRLPAAGAALDLFVSADADLNRAAVAAGLTVEDPDQHP